ERVLHALDGDDAAVVVGEHPAALLGERGEGARGDDAEDHDRDRQRGLREQELRAGGHDRSSSSSAIRCRSKSVASRTMRVTNEPRSTCPHRERWERPIMMCPTSCKRAYPSSAGTGSSLWSRTTTAPSSWAFWMFASRCRCASAAMRSGASRGVSTYATYQSV